MKLNTHSLILLPVLVLFTVSCSHKAAKKSEDTLPQIEVAIPAVDTVTIHRTYPGYLTATTEVDLVARVDGYLRSKPRDPGNFVRKGTVLYTIENDEYREAVNRAEAALATAESNYAYASERYTAMKKALASDAVSGMEVAQAKNALEEAEASVKTARASLQSARTQLSYCTVTAPCDGHVSTTRYDDGAFLAGAASPVVLSTIYDDAQMYVNFSVDDSEYPVIARLAGSDGTLNMDSIPLTFSETLPHSYTCRFNYMAPKIDKSTGTMVLQGIADNPYNELRSGMYVIVSLPVARKNSAILIRDSSIGTDQLGKYIYTLNDSDRVVYTPIKTGELIDDTLRIVESGLAPGTRYVTKALLKVRDGETVRPVEAR